MSAILAAEGVSFRVRGRALVDCASLALEPGRVMVIIGPNGAGKSTLLKLLSGEVPPQEGVVRSLGEPIAGIAAWRLAARRAVMAQAARLAFPFAVHEIVRLGLEGIGRAQTPRETGARIEEALGIADALHLAGRDYLTLSGGEQQRVQFARALCQLAAGRSIEPIQALLLDEPIASLDLHHQLALLDAARETARTGDVAVVAVLHDLNLALTYADRLVVMDKGRIVADGAPQDILTPPLMREVFGLHWPDRPALPAMPFILPQLCRRVMA